MNVFLFQEGLTAEDELILSRVLGTVPPSHPSQGGQPSHSSLPCTPDYHSPAPSLPSPSLASPGVRGQYSTPPPNMLPGPHTRTLRPGARDPPGGPHTAPLGENCSYSRLGGPPMPREAPRPGSGWAPMPPMPAPLSGSGLPPHLPTAIVPPGVPPHTRPPQWAPTAGLALHVENPNISNRRQGHASLTGWTV